MVIDVSIVTEKGKNWTTAKSRDKFTIEIYSLQDNWTLKRKIQHLLNTLSLFFYLFCWRPIHPKIHAVNWTEVVDYKMVTVTAAGWAWKRSENIINQLSTAGWENIRCTKAYWSVQSLSHFFYIISFQFCREDRNSTKCRNRMNSTKCRNRAN